MFHSFLETAKGSSETKDFETAKALFENSVKKSAKSFYGLALPDRNTEAGIFYAPHGTYQIVDYFLAFSANGMRIIQGRADGKIWTQEDMMEAAQNGSFTEVQINFQKEKGGICIEKERWILNPEKDSDTWIYILFQVISNVPLQQISTFIIYFDSRNVEFNEKINYIRLDSDGYNLLRGALSRMASGGGSV